MKNLLFLITIVFFNTLSFSQINLTNTTVEERIVATDLDVPWDMTYSSDGWIWFTELSGRISRLNPDTNELQLVFTVPDVEVFGFSSGMHSIVLHPNFETTPHVYVHYLNSTNTSKIVRYTYDSVNNTITNPLDILINIPGGVSHNGSRMFIDNDLLFISLGDSYSNSNLAQDLNSYAGKILRMNLDGSVPTDNPISDSLIFSFGHRNPQGLCLGNGFIYSSEHGTSHDDEINIIQENRNFGWPTVEGYCDLSNEITFCDANNVAEPIYTWSPSIAPCGLAFYDNSVIPEWENSLLLAVLKTKRLIQLKLNPAGDEIIEENMFLINTYGRLRDVLVIPDGRIFICTTNRDFIGVPNANDDKIIELKAQNTISIIDENLAQISLYPNPAKNELTIKSDILLDGTLAIFDITGKLISKQIFTHLNSTKIDIKKFESGLYYLNLKTNKTDYTKKFVIE